MLSSTECPSTSTTSSTHSGNQPSTMGRLKAPFFTGMTTLTVGRMARRQADFIAASCSAREVSTIHVIGPSQSRNGELGASLTSVTLALISFLSVKSPA